MGNKIMIFILSRVLYLLVTSFAVGISFSILLEMEPNQPETVMLSFFEKSIMSPIVFTLILFPFTLLVGLPSSVFKTIIKARLKIKSILFDILFYLVIAVITLQYSHNMIKSAAHQTNFEFFLNPYLLLPFIMAFILAILENIKYRKESKV